jgi:hypothetical protein
LEVTIRHTYITHFTWSIGNVWCRAHDNMHIEASWGSGDFKCDMEDCIWAPHNSECRPSWRFDGACWSITTYPRGKWNRGVFILHLINNNTSTNTYIGCRMTIERMYTGSITYIHTQDVVW